MPEHLLDLLTYRIVDVSRENLGVYQLIYFGFNAIEAVAWFAFAAIVLFRWTRHRKSRMEVLYSLLFLLFGISDMIEIIAYPLWLLLAKGAILACLLLTRRHVVRIHYPGKKF